METLETQLIIPDLWQQQAIRALKDGADAVVDAPTGAGKTYIFELFVEQELRGKAIYTVPTRALANDKLMEWRARGWNVGICTGDVADNLGAPVIVATLETQKGRFLRGKGPEYLVIDEYQMLADEIRGVNYELITALAPPTTQLLLLSGSVANPDEVANWLRRIGRTVELVRTDHRPVPLDEVLFETIRERVPDTVYGFWPRRIASALIAGMGPILAFAPRRNASESLATALSIALPVDEPIVLTADQKRLAGKKLAALLKNRIAYHHSGLNYRQRAGLIEPLAKAGQLRVVVATTGLAAGINFSTRSVIVTDRNYRAGDLHRQVRQDELLQMFGRAGRRGLDEKGFILVASGKPRLAEAKPLHLKRSNQVEWPAIIAVMQRAVESGADPLLAATDLTSRLFSEQRVPLGLGKLPATDKAVRDQEEASENAVQTRGAQSVVEILTPRGIWERRRSPIRVPLIEVLCHYRRKWKPALSTPRPLEAFRFGSICKWENDDGVRYGRKVPLATFANRDGDGELVITRWLYRKLKQTNGNQSGSLRRKNWTLSRLEESALPWLADWSGGTRLKALTEENGTLLAELEFDDVEVFACVDSVGQALFDPPERKRSVDDQFTFSMAMGQGLKFSSKTPAEAWLRLGLIDAGGKPTRRGVIFSFFNHGEGLAVAAALEDESYDVNELAMDLANIRAGHRFSELDSSTSRLGNICRITYKGATYMGYLEKGLPNDYGDGATEVLSEVAADSAARAKFTFGNLRQGDIERAGLEWRSLLLNITHAPAHEWHRWTDLQIAAHRVLGKFAPSPLRVDFPDLTNNQFQRYSCQLRF